MPYKNRHPSSLPPGWNELLLFVKTLRDWDLTQLAAISLGSPKAWKENSNTLDNKAGTSCLNLLCKRFKNLPFFSWEHQVYFLVSSVLDCYWWTDRQATTEATKSSEHSKSSSSSSNKERSGHRQKRYIATICGNAVIVLLLVKAKAHRILKIKIWTKVKIPFD